ncbi:type III-B CRISPR module RAMP protein Cmr1 [Acidilobus sp.]|uniref:type III-B CRISPR module RAMP protein Cmr1 n=1 Tax=Acidilobus sp. TaxID=1872109 RepID=UPI003CFE3DC1
MSFDESLVKEARSEALDLFEKRRLVARLRLTPTTPWWGGDYSVKTSQNVDEDEINGRLRWFLRTVYNRFCARDLSDYSEAERFVGSFLGSTGSASKYVFRANTLGPGEGLLGQLRRLPRVRLTMRSRGNLGLSEEDLLPLNLRGLELSIYRTRADEDPKYDDLVVGGSLITLAFLGVGRGANRGFGRFTPSECPAAGSQFIRELCTYIRDSKVTESFRLYYDKFKEVTGCGSVNSWEKSAVPLAPLVDGKGPDVIRAIPNCTARDSYEALRALQEAFLKANLRWVMAGRGARIPSAEVHSWLLGLPRQVKNTGYFLVGEESEEAGRRQSMLVASPVRVNNGYRLYLLPFLSLKDHARIYNMLEHRGGSGEVTRVSDLIKDEEDLKNVISEIVDAVAKAAERRCRAQHVTTR